MVNRRHQELMQVIEIEGWSFRQSAQIGQEWFYNHESRPTRPNF